MSKTIRSWTDWYLSRQELVVLSGVILFLTGLLLASPILKIVAFLLSGSLFAYVIVTRWRPKEQRGAEGDRSTVTLQEREAEMKKLVFDDFRNVSVKIWAIHLDAGQSMPDSGYGFMGESGHLYPILYQPVN